MLVDDLSGGCRRDVADAARVLHRQQQQRIALGVDPPRQHRDGDRAAPRDLRGRPRHEAPLDPAPARRGLRLGRCHGKRHGGRFGCEPVVGGPVGDGVRERRRAARAGLGLHREPLPVVGDADDAEGGVETRDRRGGDREHVLVRVVVVQQHRQGRQRTRAHAERIGLRDRRAGVDLNRELLVARLGIRIDPVIERPVLTRRDQPAVGNGPHPSAAGLVEDHRPLPHDEFRPPLLPERLAGVVQRRLPVGGAPQQTARGPLRQPRGVHLAVDGHRLGGQAEHRRAGALRVGGGPVDGDAHERGLVGEVDRVALGRGASDHDGACHVDRDRLGRALSPHRSGVGVDEHPRLPRGRQQGLREVTGVDRVADFGAARGDVPPQHRPVAGGVGEQGAVVGDGDRVGGVGRRIVIARRERVELPRVAGDLAREHGAGVGEIGDVVSGGGHDRRAGGSRRRRPHRLVVQIDRLRAVDRRDLRPAVGEQERPAGVLGDLARIGHGAHRVQFADRRVHAGVARSLAGLQRPHGRVHLGGLLSVQTRPDDAGREHDARGGDARDDAGQGAAPHVRSPPRSAGMRRRRPRPRAPPRRRPTAASAAGPARAR